MAESLKKKTAKGLAWATIERLAGQGVQFLVTILIARILTPRDFGLVGMLTVFIHVAQALIDGGFSQALIRKQDRTEADNNTVFYFNIIVSALLYGVLYLTAPFVADFYNEPQLKSMMQVLCLLIVVNSFGAIQRTLFTAQINFRTQAYVSAISSVVSGILAIIMAYKGFGVWTLVYQQLLNAVFNTVLLWTYSKWRPRLLYSWQSFKSLFAFGSNLMIGSLLDSFFDNVYQIVVGKIFSASTLGFYSQARTIAYLPSANTTGILSRVTYPVMSSISNDDKRLKTDYRKLLRVTAFVIFPLMCTLAGISKPLIAILLGERWSFSATLLLPLSLSLMWYPVHALNLNLLKVKGRSDLFLRLQIYKKVIVVVVLLLTIPFGIVFMCYCRIGTSIFVLSINTYYTGKLLNLGFFKQMQDLLPTLLLSLAIFFVMLVLCSLFDNVYLQLLVPAVSGITIYLGVAKILHFQELTDLISLIRR